MNRRLLMGDFSRADDPERDDARGDHTHEIARDLAYRRILIVNVVFFGVEGARDRDWVLIDSGVGNVAADQIREAAKARFGEGSRPAAIVLTHGHIDHIAGAKDLAAEWDVPIYAHPMEMPYLNGTAKYPPADPSVGGGMMAVTSPMLPLGPFDLSEWLQPLPEDGSVPFMPGWTWIHTPGHTPGHVSLWRESDRSLIAGDAVVTTDQESIYAALTQKLELQGPPAYLTQNWQEAGSSVRTLAKLQPNLLVTGHGRAVRGQEMREMLDYLSEHFGRIGIPEHGNYVDHPARPEDGSAYVS